MSHVWQLRTTDGRTLNEFRTDDQIAELVADHVGISKADALEYVPHERQGTELVIGNGFVAVRT